MKPSHAPPHWQRMPLQPTRTNARLRYRRLPARLKQCGGAETVLRRARACWLPPLRRHQQFASALPHSTSTPAAALCVYRTLPITLGAPSVEHTHCPSTCVLSHPRETATPALIEGQRLWVQPGESAAKPLQGSANVRSTIFQMFVR